MFQVFRRLRWLYKKLRLRRLRYALPFSILAIYTIFGAYLFRHFELEPDEERRSRYRESTEYAFNQVLNRMMEVRCEDKLLREDQNLQARHTKDALFWLIDYLNLTQVIEARSESSPWTWMGALFYAGQLYTTIGYGIPAAKTNGGRMFTMVYIGIGIPIFLIILAEVGRLLSRALRKFYKRMRSAKKKLPEMEDMSYGISNMARKMSEPVKAIYSLTPSLLSNGGSTATTKQLDSNDNLDLESGDPSKPKENNELEPEVQNELNEKLQKKSGSFPIPLALCILVLWIALSAGLFCIWETQWGYFTSVYFFFVSIRLANHLAPLGLGDIVPTKPDMLFANFMLILIGLALLSMCVNLIQGFLERLIEQLIEEYIDEIGKIAAVVTNNEEFAEEAPTPFEVGMTAEMLTIPLTSVAKRDQKGTAWSMGRSIKDWAAEKIASNLLMKRIDPHYNDSSSSESDSDDDGEHEGVLETVVEPIVHGAATISVVGEGMDGLPKISIHEGTPVSCLLFDQTSSRKVSTALTKVSSDGRKNSVKKKHHHHQRHAVNSPFAKYSHATVRAIQAIETAKMCTYRNNDFKSRLFAKFATSEKMTRLMDKVASSPPPPEPAKKNMVSCSIQTTPVTSPLMQRQRNMRSAYAGRGGNCLLESMDSTSSEVGPGDWTSTSIFDVDSLCSAGYLDMSFGYRSDSVPHLMAEPNTPQTTMNHLQSEQIRNRMYPMFSAGFVQKVVDETTGGNYSNYSTMPLPFPIGGAHLCRHSGFSIAGSSSPPVFQVESLPPGSTLTPSTPPVIQLTDEMMNTSTEVGKMPATPAPTPTPTTSPTGRHNARRKPRSQSGDRHRPPLLASIPLHHRALCNRRRFSANNCLPLPNEPTASGCCASASSDAHHMMIRCPSCHHFSTRTSPPIDTRSAEANEHHHSQTQGSAKIYARNSIAGIDVNSIQRVRDACGLLPSDFLIRHQIPMGKSTLASSQAAEEQQQATDDSGYSHSNEHSSPPASMPSSPVILPSNQESLPPAPSKCETVEDDQHIWADVEGVVEGILELLEHPLT